MAHRVWINDWVGTITNPAPGITLERIGNGTLLSTPLDWPNERILDAILTTYARNNLDRIPLPQD
ncbi:hypothetical protein I6B53_01875 [Schaalia sp. 19OD2882]|uniref:hypothetical protein n=1 Tax=Schaalia sp. 19OD2882 TaxID=2794089 RepID=UPI001C1EB9EE|nr:hypothetical protein [Schaalia sp. 19OD2882]QWW19897.1 hypothetical protein I6B53_01875 [Schaalia sp. 19OD2882]